MTGSFMSGLIDSTSNGVLPNIFAHLKFMLSLSVSVVPPVTQTPFVKLYYL